MPPQIPFREALTFWLKLGFISFGGPAGQIAIMHRELVEKRRWISEGRFLHALNYCMILPGPEAQQLATYLGWLMHRTWGGIVAGGLFVLPSLMLLIGLSWVYMHFGQTAWLSGLFYGIKPVVTAIVIQATLRIGERTLRHPALWVIAGLAFLGLSALQLPFPLIIIAAALAGYLGGKVVPSAFTHSPHGASATKMHAPALIDDTTPPPPHARFNRRHLIRVLLAGALLWLIPMGVVLLIAGSSHTLTQMGWFFTKAALLTFGGAYAVLPYVYQGAVSTFAWLSPAQMIDGLALGETTPGPLIMVVSYVAFVGGWQMPDMLALTAASSPLPGAVLAAVLVTWVTFLPSFVFILAGGPLVESTHGQLRVTAPLIAVTAAVVGVIANLALFFAGHVLWPQGFSGSVDLVAGGLVAVAAAALIGAKRSAPEVIVAGALVGLLLQQSGLV